jgi:hypothetical protein
MHLDPHGFLVFETVNSFYEAAQDPDSARMHEVQDTIALYGSSFVPMNYNNDTSITDSLDEYLCSLLNTDGVIQIDNYIFKIDYLTQNCYAMNADYIDELTDLINMNSGNAHVLAFGSDDDVLDILLGTSYGYDENQDGHSDSRKWGWFCGDRGIGHQKRPMNSAICITPANFTVIISAIIKNHGCGIYHWLNIKFQTIAQQNVSPNAVLFADGTTTLNADIVKWTPNCNPEEVRGEISNFTLDKGIKKKPLYRGVAGLHKVWIRCTYTFVGKGGTDFASCSGSTSSNELKEGY